MVQTKQRIENEETKEIELERRVNNGEGGYHSCHALRKYLIGIVIGASLGSYWVYNNYREAVERVYEFKKNWAAMSSTFDELKAEYDRKHGAK